MADPVREITSGLAAGAVTTLVMHPLDLVKVRLQVMRGSGPCHPWHFAGIKDAYRGLPINLVGNTISWGLYFFLYHEIRRSIGDKQTYYFSSALFAGLTTSVLTTPIWVLKTRILATRVADPGSYKTMAQGFFDIVRNEGVAALWRGVLPGLFGTVQASVQFSLYEHFKVYWKKTHQDAIISPLDFIVLSASSKSIAATTLYPYQVVRARIQMQHGPSIAGALRTTVRDIYTEKGIRGFYRGLLPNLLRVVPSTSITFLVYETINGM